MFHLRNESAVFSPVLPEEHSAHAEDGAVTPAERGAPAKGAEGQAEEDPEAAEDENGRTEDGGEAAEDGREAAEDGGEAAEDCGGAGGMFTGASVTASAFVFRFNFG